jgi:hypothetical protein
MAGSSPGERRLRRSWVESDNCLSAGGVGPRSSSRGDSCTRMGLGGPRHSPSMLGPGSTVHTLAPPIRGLDRTLRRVVVVRMAQQIVDATKGLATATSGPSLVSRTPRVERRYKYLRILRVEGVSCAPHCVPLERFTRSHIGRAILCPV